VQPVGLRDLDAGILVLDAEQELRALSEAQNPGHARVRTVRADKEARCTESAEIEAALYPLRLPK
jgi:hypothetical protein